MLREPGETPNRGEEKLPEIMVTVDGIGHHGDDFGECRFSRRLREPFRRMAPCPQQKRPQLRAVTEAQSPGDSEQLQPGLLTASAQER